jgi:hypothetical protein
MSKRIALALATLLLAAPAVAQDQTRQQTRDPSTHVDGATPTQQRDRTMQQDRLRDGSGSGSQARNRAMGSMGSAGGSRGSGGGSGGSGGYRGGK